MYRFDDPAVLAAEAEEEEGEVGAICEEPIRAARLERDSVQEEAVALCLEPSRPASPTYSSLEHRRVLNRERIGDRRQALAVAVRA